MFESNAYEVRQKMSIGNKYNIYEGTGDDAEHILQAKQKILKMKEDFRFQDPETEEDVIRVTTDEVIDYKATYTIVDVRNDEIIGAVERLSSSSSLRQKWGLFEASEDDEAEQVGVLKEDSLLKAFLRRQVTGLIPIAFDIYEPEKSLSKDGSTDRDQIAEIEGAFSFRDKYTIEVEDDDLDPRLAVIGAAVIDAIEAN